MRESIPRIERRVEASQERSWARRMEYRSSIWARVEWPVVLVMLLVFAGLLWALWVLS